MINRCKLKRISRHIRFLIGIISSIGFSAKIVLGKLHIFLKLLHLGSKLKELVLFHARLIKSALLFFNIHTKGRSSMMYKIESPQVAFSNNINFLNLSNLCVKAFRNIFNTLKNGINKFFKRNYLS